MIKRDENGRILPGQGSLNPTGRTPISEEEKEMRDNFRRAFVMLGTKTLKEIEMIAKDPNSSGAYVIAAKALEWGFKKGNPSFFQQIFDRTLGKPPSEIHLGGVNGDPIRLELAKLSDQELMEKIPSAIEALKMKGEIEE